VYKVIPGGVGNKIEERMPDLVIRPAPEDAVDEVDEDDPYKDFVVPDDLMW
jgi:uncharacterized protein YaiL (DUF2058 family)